MDNKSSVTRNTSSTQDTDPKSNIKTEKTQQNRNLKICATRTLAQILVIPDTREVSSV